MSDDRSARSTATDLPALADERPATYPISTPRVGRLPEALFEIAVAAMWSDGDLLAAEVERGHALARELRSSPRRGGSPFGAIAAGALPFGELDFDGLLGEERRLAYAIAQWVATDHPSPGRTGFMRGLQLRLRLSDDETRELREVVLAVEDPQSDAVTSLRLLLSALCPDAAFSANS